MTEVCEKCGSPRDLLRADLFDDRYGYPGRFATWECPKCETALLVPAPDESDLARIYTEYYPRRNLSVEAVVRSAKFRGTNGDRVRAFWMGTDLNCHYHAKRGERVLEVGSGTGTALLELRNCAIEAVGTEYDLNVREIAESLSLNIHFGGIESLPEKYGRFDCVVMNQVLEHVPNAEAFLNEIRTKLTVDGRVVLSIPNFSSIYRKPFGSRWINWHVPYHLWFYSESSLAELAERAGFHVHSSRTITPTEWFKLQILAFVFRSAAGERNPIWNPYEKLSVAFVFCRRLATLFGYFMTPCLRIVDFFGRGDGLLIVLKPKASTPLNNGS